MPISSTSLTSVAFVPITVLSLFPVPPFFLVSFPLTPFTTFVPIPLETLFRLVLPAILLLSLSLIHI